MRLTRFRLALLVVLALTARSVGAADKWIRVRSEHFDTVGNTTDSDLRRIAQTLEHFHEVVVTAALRGAGASSTRTSVIVFRDDVAFSPYKPQGAGRSALGGFFAMSEDSGTILALNAENSVWAFRIVLNGYSRSVLQRSLGTVPLWLGTGLGQVYETFEERAGGKGALIGRPEDEVVKRLASMSLVPVGTLITLNESSPGMTLGEANRVRFDGESWALVHYLSFGAHRDQFRQYLAAVQSGGDPVESFRTALGDLDALTRELTDYIRKFSFPAMQVMFDQNVRPSLPPKGEVLGEADAEAYLASLLVRSGDRAQARTRLQKAVAASPQSAAATAAFARLELADDHLAAAILLFEKAASLAPEDPTILADLGHTLALDVAGKDGPSPAAILHARTALTHAADLDAKNPRVLADLGWMLLMEPADATRATTLLTDAVKLMPTRELYRLWLADALVREQQYEDARKLLGPLMARGSSAELRQAARQMLGVVAGRENRARVAPTTP
ncbi:MAG: hypothetical protein U0Q11_09910 [Vicinamibacterales bacterium]